jgi:beta-aspartyl-peptidase (threonine type)
MSGQLDREYRAALTAALGGGHRILEQGGSSLDAVEAAVVAMEDCPLFNAGRGSAYTREGTIEMEAAIMDGRAGLSGAALLLRRVRNPVRLARRVMERTPYAMLGGEAAERFAEEQRLPCEPPEYFRTDYRWDSWVRLRDSGGLAQVEDSVATLVPDTDASMGTVGAVALDSSGNLAAATSTGGLTGKSAGRIGDSPLVGAGTFANNRTCAISCTGQGEYFLRGTVAYDISARMAYGSSGLEQAAKDALQASLSSQGGKGGLIGIDRRGNRVLTYNTEGMYRGWIGPEGLPSVSIYE